MLTLELCIFQKNSLKKIFFTTNSYRIQAYNSIMCGYCWIRFMDCMLKDESVLGHTNLFPPNEYEKNDKIVLKYFQ